MPTLTLPCPPAQHSLVTECWEARPRRYGGGIAWLLIHKLRPFTDSGAEQQTDWETCDANNL